MKGRIVLEYEDSVWFFSRNLQLNSNLFSNTMVTLLHFPHLKFLSILYICCLFWMRIQIDSMSVYLTFTFHRFHSGFRYDSVISMHMHFKRNSIWKILLLVYLNSYSSLDFMKSLPQKAFYYCFLCVSWFKSRKKFSIVTNCLWRNSLNCEYLYWDTTWFWQGNGLGLLSWAARRHDLLMLTWC